jgi:hypothetical protein
MNRLDITMQPIMQQIFTQIIDFHIHLSKRFRKKNIALGIKANSFFVEIVFGYKNTINAKTYLDMLFLFF